MIIELLLGDFIVMVEFPDDIAHIITMLPLHPTGDITAAGILCAHKLTELRTERGCEAGGVIAVYAEKEFPEQ